MGQYDIALAVIILLTGISIVLLLKLEDHMEKYSQAIARLQDSANKSNAKIDQLLAGGQGAIDAAVEAALSTAADQVNAISDTLDSKNA